MESIFEGGVFRFTVVSKTASGRVVPTTSATVATDTQFGSASVNSDGSGGTFQSTLGMVGDVVLTPSDAGVTGTPFPLTVKPDDVVVSVEIVADPITAVTVVPA